MYNNECANVYSKPIKTNKSVKFRCTDRMSNVVLNDNWHCTRYSVAHTRARTYAHGSKFDISDKRKRSWGCCRCLYMFRKFKINTLWSLRDPRSTIILFLVSRSDGAVVCPSELAICRGIVRVGFLSPLWQTKSNENGRLVTMRRSFGPHGQYSCVRLVFVYCLVADVPWRNVLVQSEKENKRLSVH